MSEKKWKLLYGDIAAWKAATLAECLEAIRVDICTGPCGQSQSVMERRSRINDALTDAIKALAATGAST